MENLMSELGGILRSARDEFRDELQGGPTRQPGPARTAAGRAQAAAGRPAQGGAASTSGAQRTSAAAATADPLSELSGGPMSFWAALGLICVVYLFRRLLALAFLIVGGAAVLNNPARDPHLRGECWEILDRARRDRIAEEADRNLQEGNVFTVLKNAFVEGVRSVRRQRVLVDFLFFSVAFFKGGSEVDHDLCALGLMGTWRVMRLDWLRRFAEQHFVEVEAEDPHAAR